MLALVEVLTVNAAVEGDGDGLVTGVVEGGAVVVWTGVVVVGVGVGVEDELQPATAARITAIIITRNT
jgi:hypothetical protein